MDYLKWRGDLTFSQDAFNEVDNLLLSYVAYVNLEGLSVGAGEEQVTLEEVSRRFFVLHSEEVIYETGAVYSKNDGTVEPLPHIYHFKLCQYG